MQGDYIDYMMGHTVGVYHDVQSKGVEFLRAIYTNSGLHILPRTSSTPKERLRARKTVGIAVILIGVLFLAAGVGNLLRNGLTVSLSNGLPYFGVGLLLLVAGRYLTA